MTIVYNHNGITVKRRDTSFGVDYRISDGVYDFSLGNKCPELTEENLKDEIESYLQMRYEDIEADCEETIF